ncbi:hypothetical protein PENNAL_c0067G01778 [Penicillium nalgiovense]|uniref:FAD-binding FR-type domain-containing protein n=1 Tax=Penicillium nalgiovense TaxID=60175 RepID=A0A1V6XMH3_PENNA|nr:hypothetical protein PENNAL_c0067G01778 [Penicillium nalgiovense]
MLLRWLVIALALGVWANHEDERCVTAVCSAYNYISFVGLPTKGKDIWVSQCRNPLKVASIYAASEIYCNERERGIGLTQLAGQCQEFGNLELLSREALAENLTDDAIRNMKTVDYQELSRGEPADTPVLLSAAYFDLMFNTIVRPFRPSWDLVALKLTNVLGILGIRNLVTSCIWGTFVMILLLITSLDRIRIATYELFLIAHVVLSILTLVGCFYHTVIFEGNEYWKYLWPTLGLWVIDRFLRIVRLCYCNIHVSLSNRRLAEVSVSRMVYNETADVVRLEITPGTPSLQPSPGQYYFLYQPFRLTGWESHPFTIGAWSYEIGDQTSLVPIFEGRIKSLDVSHVPLLAGGVSDRDYQCISENGSSGQEEYLKLKLTFWVRPYDGWTKQLRRQCLSSPAKTSETTILLEGPYGETFPLWRYESVLIIVGGTGIASAVPYIQDHLRRSVEDWHTSPENEKTRVRDMELVWTTKQAAFIRDVARRELKHALKREDFSASFYATRDSTTYSEDPTDFGFEIQSGRPHLQSLIMSRACDACSAGTSLAILVCGPPRMADEARAATHLAMRQGHRSIKFVEESFTW